MEDYSYKKVKQVLWIILFANIGVALLKIIIGRSIKSTSMTADGFHSISDGASNIVGLIGISLASKPLDKEHPYGHNKFEVISGLFIGGMLLFIGSKIVVEAILRFKNPVIPTITIESLIVLVITLLINIFVCTYEYRVGKKLNSYILISDSLHTKSDIFVSIGVLITLIGVRLGLPAIIDSIASLIVAGFILHASYEIFKSTIDILVDKAIIDEEDIREILKEFEEVKCAHNIRSRGSENNAYVDMHVMVNPNVTVEEAHILNHDIEEMIREKINKSAQVIVHIEPYYE
ncbi:cation transporter [Romboutsia maritimum]|uniref:Cation transporter n=1 Tax=Romboutsia maritimum TaxID=2020948 RepID=A0A371IRR9_9FIRM|nr:cation diffusion facilitator family transporter [Romboutsia maritimum]RDY23178.1 cation transporter [Romboutsia maritimum]